MTGPSANLNFTAHIISKEIHFDLILLSDKELVYEVLPGLYNHEVILFIIAYVLEIAMLVHNSHHIIVGVKNRDRIKWHS